MALTELKGRQLGTQRVVIERGPVRVFAQALLDDDRDESVWAHTVRSSSVGSEPSNQSVVSTRRAILQPSAVRTKSSS